MCVCLPLTSPIRLWRSLGPRWTLNRYEFIVAKKFNFWTNSFWWKVALKGFIYTLNFLLRHVNLHLWITSSVSRLYVSTWKRIIVYVFWTCWDLDVGLINPWVLIFIGQDYITNLQSYYNFICFLYNITMVWKFSLVHCIWSSPWNIVDFARVFCEVSQPILGSQFVSLKKGMLARMWISFILLHVIDIKYLVF